MKDCDAAAEVAIKPYDVAECGCGATALLYAVVVVGYAFTGVQEEGLRRCATCITSAARRGESDPGPNKGGRPKRALASPGRAADVPGEPKANEQNMGAPAESSSVPPITKE